MISMSNVSVHSDKGVRSNNEDRASFALHPEYGGLLVVADGMGGHEGGEVASDIVVKSLTASFKVNGYNGSTEALINAIDQAHQCVLQQAEESPEIRGMGSTLLAVVLLPTKAVVANVGDSRAYQFREDCVRRLTVDDLYISQLLGIDDRVARKHPQGHVLSQAIGAETGISPSVHTFDLQPGDTFVLCTDGVHEVLTEPTMRGIIDQSTPTTAAEQLVFAAIRAGSNDNCTAIVARIPGELG